MLRFLINRPVAVLLTTCGLVVLGLVVLGTLPVSLLPEVPIPQVTVQVSSPNTSAREVENTVTRPLRHQLMQVGQLADIRSQTRNGSATITLELGHGTDVELAFIEVNEKIDQALGSLPPDVERPRAIRSSITDIPVFYLSIFTKNNSEGSSLELAELAQHVFRRRIEQLPEVAFADLSGQAGPEVVISPKTAPFQSLGLTEADLANILRNNDYDLGSILVQDGHYQYHLRFQAGLRSVQDVREIWFRHGGQVLQLQAVAEVEMRPRPRNGLYLHDGQEAIVFSVHKQAGAQLFAMKKSFAELLAELEHDFPGYGFAVSNDQSELLAVSVANLRSSLGWGALFAFAVLFVFFRQWRTPLLIALVVPVALILALFGFYLTGTSINVVSLSGLILGVGLMIDNGIIVLENIRQFRGMGHPLTEACVLGAEEVIRPLVSSALTTCSVFVPLVFLSGVGGALFGDQALSVTLALGASLLVAYLLLPVFLNLGKNKAALPLPVGQEEVGRFEKTVDWALARRWLVLAGFALLVGAGFCSLFFLEKQAFPPLTREGLSVQVDWNGPVSVEENRERVSQLLAALEGSLRASDVFIGEQQFLLGQQEQGSNEAGLLLYGEPAELSGRLSVFFTEKYPAAVVEQRPLKTLFDEVFGSEQPPLTAHLQAAEGRPPSLATVENFLQNIEKQGVEVQALLLQEQYVVEVRSEEALRYGVAEAAVRSSLEALFGQRRVGTLRSGDSEVPIVASGGAGELQALLGTAAVRSERGDWLPLRDFVHMERQAALKAITAGKAGESVDLHFWELDGGLLAQLRQAAVAGGLSVHFSGAALADERAVRELVTILAISLLLLYLILAAQFESLMQPLIVILTVPVGGAGALLLLWAAEQSLNLVSLTGLMVMGGIVVNDAILKVDLLNRLRREMPLQEAIRRAGQRRLLPIVMTSATTVLALLPVLFFGGLGAELQQPLAWAVIGGLLAGTVASLYFVPLLYVGFFGQKKYSFA